MLNKKGMRLSNRRGNSAYRYPQFPTGRCLFLRNEGQTGRLELVLTYMPFLEIVEASCESAPYLSV
jgi:hypothetical protein